MQKIARIFLNFIPVLIMIGFVPLIQNDYLLTLFYIIVIFISLRVKKVKNDNTLLVVGFFVMTISELIFIKTGVETFTRNSLFGLIPLWLPFLWAYGFVAMSRGIRIIEQ